MRRGEAVLFALLLSCRCGEAAFLLARTGEPCCLGGIYRLQRILAMSSNGRRCRRDHRRIHVAKPAKARRRSAGRFNGEK